MVNKLFITGIFIFLLFFSLDIFPCTTFVISGKATPDGKPLLFKNRDSGEMQNALVYFNDGKYKYIGLVNGTDDWKTMVWGGYNETGFAIMNSAAYNNNIDDTSGYKDQEGVIMKMALQYCETLKDFETLLDTIKKPSGSDANYGVIDAYGGAAYYETGNYDYKKYDVNDTSVSPDGILIRTNHSLSGVIEKGYGFCRYNTAEVAIQQAAAEKQITPQFLFNKLSRNLSHSLTKTNLWNEIPETRDVAEYKFFLDYIPRYSTSSAIMIVGAKDKSKAHETMMWTILGFPLTSVAVPTWIAAENTLPQAVAMNQELRSPLCVAALKLKDECFPVTYDRQWRYINLSAVINKEEKGIMQLLQPVENEVFIKAGSLTSGREKLSKKNINEFYSWVDQYLEEKYLELFDMNLFAE